MFEVQDLRYATLATVSRCGMVWFSEDLLTPEMVFENYMNKLKNIPLEDTEEEYKIGGPAAAKEGQEEIVSPTMQVHVNLVKKLSLGFMERDHVISETVL